MGIFATIVMFIVYMAIDFIFSNVEPEDIPLVLLYLDPRLLLYLDETGEMSDNYGTIT